MKRKITRIFFVVVLLVILGYSISYGVESKIDAAKTERIHAESNRDKDVLKILKDSYGYEGDYIPEEIKSQGKITIKKEPTATGGVGETVSVIFRGKIIKERVKISELKSVYGYDGNEKSVISLKDDITWDAVVIFTIGNSINTTNTGIDYTINATKIYTGEDIKKGQATEVSAEKADTKAADGLHEGQDKVDELLKGLREKVLLALLDGVRLVFGEWFQMLANMVQTITNETVTDVRLAYKYDELQKDGQGTYKTNGSGKRDMYTNVKDYQDTNKDWQKKILVENETEGFTKDKTEIPVIPADLYNIGIGNINVLDANFLRVDTSIHDTDSIWMKFRNLFSVITHITIYLAAGTLITSLIYHGIHIVRGAIDNPSVQAGHREGLNRFITSLLMLVGTIIIMAICLNASSMFFDIVNMKDSSGQISNELPIRVNVKNVYSFSTNFTGFVRFMSEIDNADAIAAKAMYTFTYIALAITNFVAVIAMLLRTLLMFLLGIAGPIIAALHAWHLEEHSPINFRTWVQWYVCLASVQIIFAVVSRVILETVIIG